ncbi:ribbon-helix-helix protein, CopG family [Halopiger thermotolerans]
MSDDPMQRITLRVPKTQLEDLDALVDEGEYPNRSEAVREAIQQLLAGDDTIAKIDAICSELERLQEATDNEDVELALEAAVSSVWRASVLERAEQNNDIPMVADAGAGLTTHLGPDPAAYERERGESTDD